MNYIYDVIADFGKFPYDFFEWNKTDTITHLKKILIVRVHKIVMYDFVYKKVKVNKQFLNYIKNKTEFYSKDFSSYIVIFTDTYSSICIKFTEDGINKYKSFLQIEEEEEVLENSNRLDITEIEYDVLKVNYIVDFKTRKEKEVSNFILRKITELYNNDDIVKLKYIYYDCFNNFVVDKNIIYDSLCNEINSNNTLIIKQIYSFFKLLAINDK